MSKIDLESIWDSSTPAWIKMIDSGMKLFRDKIRDPAIIETLGNVKNKKILDIACGEGDSSRLIASQGAIVTGLDISSNMIQAARQRSKNIEYIVGNAHEIPFEKESFDYVVCLSLMNIPDLDKTYNEFYRVLKFGGRLIVNTVHPCFKANPNNYFLPHKNNKTPGLFVNEYFRDEPWISKTTLNQNLHGNQANQDQDIFQTVTFPYTISSYINKLINAGFRLDLINEPKALVSESNSSQELKFWALHAARNLIFGAEKI